MRIAIEHDGVIWEWEDRGKRSCMDGECHPNDSTLCKEIAQGRKDGSLCINISKIEYGNSCTEPRGLWLKRT